ncbi:unnamed protein product [Candidula unifasciata]|uniref:Fucosyltransferase N-terminal domain-containing protein n=1 Tax=Candidula unifasciata TaxID=100452 RepID=A0A8S3ZUR2_9EUPU|nr:unnamed protein product [Candidula unifasciata]
MPALCLQQKAIMMSVIILSTVSVNVYVFYVEVAAFSHVLYRTLVNARIAVYHYINVRNVSDAWRTGQATHRFQLIGHGLNIVELASSATAAMFDSALGEESSFTECPLPSTNDVLPQNSNYINRTFHVAFLQRSQWLNKDVFNFSSCKFTNCHFHGFNVTATTDVVIVDADYLTAKQKLPTKHWKHQLYILAVRESAIHTVSRLLIKTRTLWSRPFNMTLSYRRDSEMCVPYTFWFHPKPLDRRPDYCR